MKEKRHPDADKTGVFKNKKPTTPPPKPNSNKPKKQDK